MRAATKATASRIADVSVEPSPGGAPASSSRSIGVLVRSPTRVSADAPGVVTTRVNVSVMLKRSMAEGSPGMYGCMSLK